MKSRRRKNVGKKKKRITKKNGRKGSRSSRKARGLEECCMCGSKFNKKTGLIPQECLMKYGKVRAHKVCPRCWWGEFAKEGASHKCPGCVKGLPVHKDPNAGKVVDLTDDFTEGREDAIESIEDAIEAADD